STTPSNPLQGSSHLASPHRTADTVATAESLSRRDAIVEVVASPGAAAPAAADDGRRECRRDAATRTEPVLPLTRWPLSTLSWIISSSILDISSTLFRFFSAFFCGESNVTGVTGVIGVVLLVRELS